MKQKLDPNATAAKVLCALLAPIAGFAAAESDTSKFEKDRQAILAMAGDFYVDFQFFETVAIDPEYKLRKPYKSDATETVFVIRDTGKNIVLQHILWVPETELIVKHWKQEWTFEDPLLNEFVGDNTWVQRKLSPDEYEGAWSQRVSQVDDSPRYEGFGKWVHEENLTYWQSAMTQRPLPRREYTKRKDYKVMKCINRHTLTPTGWVHEQDNYKQVAKGGGVLCREAGLNIYERTDKVDFSKAMEYWEETKEFWEIVSAEFDRILADQDKLTLRGEVEGARLYKLLFNAAKASSEVAEGSAEDGPSIVRKFIVGG